MNHLDAWESGVWKKELEKQLEEDRLKMANVGELENLVTILNREGKAFYPDFRWNRESRTDDLVITLTDKQCFHNSMDEAVKSVERFDYEVTERDTLKSLLCSKLGIGRHKDQPIYVEDGNLGRGKVLEIHCQEPDAIDDVAKKAKAGYGKALKEVFGKKGIKLEKRPFSDMYLAMSRDKTR